MKDLRNYSLAQHNTFGIDAKCSRFIEFSSVAEAKETVKATINYYMENAHFMRAELQKLGLRVYGGENAPYLWVKTPNNTPSWKFFEEMLYGASVVCTPGVGFGPSGEGYIRLTAFGEHEDCKEAMERIAKWLGK